MNTSMDLPECIFMKPQIKPATDAEIDAIKTESVV